MRIAAAEVRPYGGPLRSLASNAQARWTERRGLLLRLADADGRVGQGEASPLPGYSPDSLDRARACINAMLWEHFELDLSRRPRVAIAEVVEHVDPASPSARFAVETALFDLVGQRLRRPVHSLLVETPPAPRPLAALVTSESPDAAFDACQKAVAAGFSTIKLKIGRDFDEELPMLERLRADLGPNIALRLDANQRLDPGDAFQQLSALAAIRPEFVEEPLPLDALLRMPKALVPVALDESLQGADADLRIASALERGFAEVLVLKPMALGGSLRCLRLVELARRRGATVVVSHLLDGPVGRAAAGELALAVGGHRAAGLADHAGLTAWPEVVAPSFEDTRLQSHVLPGLGLPLLGEPLASPGPE